MRREDIIEKYQVKGLGRLPEEEYSRIIEQINHNFKKLGLTNFGVETFEGIIMVKFVKAKYYKENGRSIVRNVFKVTRERDPNLDKALRQARLLVKKSRHFKGSRKDFLRTFP